MKHNRLRIESQSLTLKPDSRDKWAIAHEHGAASRQTFINNLSDYPIKVRINDRADFTLPATSMLVLDRGLDVDYLLFVNSNTTEVNVEILVGLPRSQG